MTGADLSGADLRNASYPANLTSSAITTNTILRDGQIKGLNLDSTNPTLVVRNYSDPINIEIENGMSMEPQTSLVFQLDGNSWGSTISFAPGIPVILDGTLELDVEAGFNPAIAADDTVHLFDWTGASRSGSFSSIISDPPPGYTWDTSNLYSTGEVTLEVVPEPSALVLLAAGAIGLVGYGWRRLTRRAAVLAGNR